MAEDSKSDLEKLTAAVAGIQAVVTRMEFQLRELIRRTGDCTQHLTANQPTNLNRGH